MLENLVVLAAEAEVEGAVFTDVPPIAGGLVAFGILMVLLFIVVMFGRGREHS